MHISYLSLKAMNVVLMLHYGLKSTAQQPTRRSKHAWHKCEVKRMLPIRDTNLTYSRARENIKIYELLWLCNQAFCCLWVHAMPLTVAFISQIFPFKIAFALDSHIACSSSADERKEWIRRKSFFVVCLCVRHHLARIMWTHIEWLTPFGQHFNTSTKWHIENE